MNSHRTFDSNELQPSTPLTGSLYVRTTAHLRGPFDVSVLKSMHARGEIHHDTLLSPDRVRWVTASSLPELFPAGLFARTAPTSEQEMLWHVMIEGYRQGPISWDSLYELAESGKLRAFDKVTVDGGDKWIRASTVKGLPVPADSGESVRLESNVSWLIGGGIAATILVVVPLVLMLVWNEKRIGRDMKVIDREDAQGHVIARQDAQNQSSERIEDVRANSQESVATITGAATVKSAALNAAAQGAIIAREQRRHEQEIAVHEKEVAAINENSAAVQQSGKAQADASREAADRIINAIEN